MLYDPNEGRERKKITTHPIHDGVYGTKKVIFYLEPDFRGLLKYKRATRPSPNRSQRP